MRIKKSFFIVLSIVLLFVFMTFAAACNKEDDNADPREENYSGAQFESDAKSSYSTSYSQLSATKTNSKNLWRDGMVTGNGRQGAIIAGSPYEDTIVFRTYILFCQIRIRE